MYRPGVFPSPDVIRPTDLPLSKSHPHPLDGTVRRLTKEDDGEEKRRYVDSEGRTLVGSTSLLDDVIFPRFDAVKIIEKMRENVDRFESGQYAGMTNVEISLKWAREGEEAANLGSAFHDRVELYYETGGDMWRTGEQTRELEIERAKFASFESFRIAREWTIWRVEMKITAEGVGGMVDALFKNSQGKFVVVDWKRSKKINKDGFRGERVPAGVMKGLANSNGAKYNMQISMYAYMLRLRYGFPIANEGYIVSIHPNYDSYEIFRVEIDWKRAQALLEHANVPGTKERIWGREDEKEKYRADLEEAEKCAIDGATFEPDPEPEPKPELESKSKAKAKKPHYHTDALFKMVSQGPQKRKRAIGSKDNETLADEIIEDNEKNTKQDPPEVVDV